jgi:hypothetical protein
MSKLLREFVSLQIKDANLSDLAKKAREAKQPLVVTALLQRADDKNQNNRRYPRSILEREVENYRKAISENRAGGELNHPENSVIDLERLSHRIRDIWWEGNEVWGKVEIHPSLPKGDMALGILESGMRTGISSRGIGEVQKDHEGVDVVDESFVLLCFDLVSEPSTQNAWLFKEGKDISLQETRQLLSKNDRINRIVNEILKK